MLHITRLVRPEQEPRIGHTTSIRFSDSAHHSFDHDPVCRLTNEVKKVADCSQGRSRISAIGRYTPTARNIHLPHFPPPCFSASHETADGSYYPRKPGQPHCLPWKCIGSCHACELRTSVRKAVRNTSPIPILTVPLGTRSLSVSPATNVQMWRRHYRCREHQDSE